MLKVRYSSKFKKDFKANIKRGYDTSLFEKVVGLLREQVHTAIYFKFSL